MKYKYKVRYINGNNIRIIPYIDIEDPTVEDVGDFLFSDVDGDEDEYIEAIDKVVAGEIKPEILCGNMYMLSIFPEYCEIRNQYAEEMGEPDRVCRIETSELREFILLWKQVRREHREWRKKKGFL